MHSDRLLRSLLILHAFLLPLAHFAHASGGQTEAPPRLAVTAKLAAGRQTVRIVCFGDSITGVYYHTGSRRAWCGMLGIALSRIYPQAKIQMINAGISGHTTAAGLKRIKPDVLDQRPDLVVTMFGMNDVARLTSDEYRANLTEIVRQCRVAGAEIILMTPNSIYPEDSQRPVDRLAEYAEIVRQVGRDNQLPVADCYRTYEEIRRISRQAWRSLMSETIHPNMRGHKVFAEEVAWVISGRRVSLADVGPPSPGIPQTLKLLQQNRRVRILAMEPYDELIGPALRRIKPGVQVEVTGWKVTGKSLPEIEQEARGNGLWESRKQGGVSKFDLVILAVPASATASSDEQAYRAYSQILNFSLGYAQADWDCIAILPSVVLRALDQAQRVAEQFGLEVVGGQDISSIRRRKGDSRPPSEILVDWLESQYPTDNP